jgi:hypothetical protein
MIITITTTIFSVFIGALVTWFVARIYYKRASEELTKEASDLRKLNVLILRALENAGLVELNRDENGNPTGLVIKLKVGRPLQLKGDVKSADVKIDD